MTLTETALTVVPSSPSRFGTCDVDAVEPAPLAPMEPRTKASVYPVRPTSRRRG
jgi:hypothetical protein